MKGLNQGHVSQGGSQQMFNPQNYKPNGGFASVPQTLKFNMGSGNNFIVKNSNIVITQAASNQDNQGQPTSLMQNAMPQQAERRPGKRSGQSASRQGPPQATSSNQFSIENKQQIYQVLPNQTSQGLANAPAKFGLNSGFNSTKVRTQRFGVTSGIQNQNNLGLTTTTSPNYNVVGNYNQFATGPNTTNNANFMHKQRQLSYSPNMQASKVAGPSREGQNKKKRNISEAGQVPNLLGQDFDPLNMNNQGPNRRSQSKNDKYKDQADIISGLTFTGTFGPASKGGLGGAPQPMVRTSQQNQRFTPMNQTKGPSQGLMQKRSGVNQSRDRTNVGFNTTGNAGQFNRPQSATQKPQNEASNERSEQLNSGLRQLLQQNAQQNKDNQKLLQQKIGQASGGRNIGGTNKEQISKGNTFGLTVTSQNSRMVNQQQIHRTTNNGTNPSAANDYLNGLIQTTSNNQNEGTVPLKTQGHILQNITKRSQSQHSHLPGAPNPTQPTGNGTIQNNQVSGKKSQMKPLMSNSLFTPTDSSEQQQQLNTQQFINNEAHQNPISGGNSRGGHKRPKSNLDGFFKSSKNGPPINSNELPQISEVQNRNFQRNQNKTPVLQQSHQVASKQMPLTASDHLGQGSQSQNPQQMMQMPIQTTQGQKPLPQQNSRQSQPQSILPQSGQPAAQAANQQKNSFYTANPRQMYTNCVTKFAFATKTGQSPSNPHKQNQDAWITVPHFCGLKYCHFFAVADGHGQYGREVSSYMKQRLPQFIEAEMRFMFQKYNEHLLKKKDDENLNTDEICIAFNNAFLNCNEELFSGIMDVRFSGSTCVSIMTLGQKLFCVNVGDSRGIVVKYQDNKIVAQAISRDQKPSQNDEATRIINCGGRIDSFRDPDKNPIGPLRVWLKTEDIPGLAMTRSFGDEVASRVGVTAEPEILELDLCKEDRFIVIASDGVWEFISNDEIAKIVKPFFDAKNAEKAAEAVVKESYLRWKREEEGIVDDITCVIVFLDVKLPQQEPSPNLLGIETQDKKEQAISEAVSLDHPTASEQQRGIGEAVATNI